MAYSSVRNSIDGLVTDVHVTTKKATLGERFRDENGKEYIYLTGATSTAAGDWVTYDEAFLTTRLAANAVGPVAIAMGAVDATTKFGWYQIFGVNTTSGSDAVATDKALYIDATVARVDDAAVTGDLIVGACSVAGDNTNVLSVWLNYPFVTDILG